MRHKLLMVLPALGHTESHHLQFYSVFASSKIRQINEIFESSTKPVKLKQLYKVRWLSMGCVS